MLRANKLKCNAVAHLLHRNVKATCEEKTSQFSNPTGLSKTGNLLRFGRFGVWAYTFTSRASHLAFFGHSQNPGSTLSGGFVLCARTSLLPKQLTDSQELAGSPVQYEG